VIRADRWGFMTRGIARQRLEKPGTAPACGR
jgi:hypothetical protein